MCFSAKRPNTAALQKVISRNLINFFLVRFRSSKNAANYRIYLGSIFIFQNFEGHRFTLKHFKSHLLLINHFSCKDQRRVLKQKLKQTCNNFLDFQDLVFFQISWNTLMTKHNPNRTNKLCTSLPSYSQSLLKGYLPFNLCT